MKKLVIGFGPGRCGTMSLAQFLDQQEGYNITHEEMMLTDNLLHNNFELEMQRLAGYDGEVVGDIGWYWFYYADRFVGISNIIYIYRDPELIADSFWGYYHIPAFKGRLKGKDESLLVTYPWLDEMPSREAILRSIKNYHANVMMALRRHGKKIFVIETDQLNDEERLSQLCDFLSIPESKKVLTPVHVNKQAAKQELMEELYGSVDNRSVGSG